MGRSCLQHMGLHVPQLQQKQKLLYAVSVCHVSKVLTSGLPFQGPGYQPRSRGSTHRSQTQPMGSNVGVTYERNIMVGRVIVLLCLCWAKGIWWMMEQPKGSLLEGHVLFQAMLKLKHVAVSRTTCSLGWFGADTLKPIWIYSSISAGFKEHVLSSTTALGINFQNICRAFIFDTFSIPIILQNWFIWKVWLSIGSQVPVAVSLNSIAKVAKRLQTLPASRTDPWSWKNQLRWWLNTPTPTAFSESRGDLGLKTAKHTPKCFLASCFRFYYSLIAFTQTCFPQSSHRYI